ncbi:MAG: PQQ-dependent sugar dehydrogenase [Pseudomonadota bacterium]
MIRLFLLLFLIPVAAAANTYDTSAGKVKVATVVEGLDTPWSVAFLPDGGLLITERDGELLHFTQDGERREINGVPEVYARNQGGLFDVLVPRDFAETGQILLTYAEPRRGGAGTALAAARLNAADGRLEDLKVLFRMTEPTRGGRHFGGRIVEAGDGTLFLSTGDRGERPSAQEMDLHNGKIIRINRDGSIPSDNPFIDGPTPEVWTLGHRNPQGLAIDAEGRLWTNSHGARGGDEINLIEPGKNYGWPVISYGRHYVGGTIGVGPRKEGLEQPKHYWDPSIAPSGLAIYSGKLWPEWEGSLLVGSLKFDLISRLSRNGTEVTGEEELLRDEFVRIRDVREGPDGAIWFLAVGDGALMRMSPAE